MSGHRGASHGGSGGQMNHKDGGIKNFPTAPLQGWRNLPPACLPGESPVCASSPSLPPSLNVSTPFPGWGGVGGL